MRSLEAVAEGGLVSKEVAIYTSGGYMWVAEVKGQKKTPIPA